MKKLVVFTTLVALSACGSKSDDQTAAGAPSTGSSTETLAATSAPAAFSQCAVCHKVDEDGGNGVGPNLHGVVGKKAGQIAGFAYSEGMKSSGLTWDEATLDAFLTNPRAMVATTRMSFAGQSDPAKRKEIIDWLKKN